MKKNLIVTHRWQNYALLKKLLMTMKLTLLIMFVSATTLFAHSGYAQSTRINLNMSNTSVKNILAEIEANSEFLFLYNSKLVDVERKVNIKAKSRKIEEILNELFTDGSVVYTVLDKQIVLTSRENKLALSRLTHQKQILVSGYVKDVKTGESLPGVNVLEQGTSNGVMTDGDGNFSLGVENENAVLIFSFIGYQTQTVSLNGKTSVEIFLTEDVKNLDEVVVVGYGTQKRKDLTSSISTIDEKVISNQTVSNAASALQGRMAGVQVVSNGAPGSSPSIRIRGTGSIYNSSPLYVVDGMIVDNINYLGPNDIESFSVLRDASASAIYGVRAANGVILVTTKKGSQSGKINVFFNSYVGIKNVSHLLEMASTDAYVTMYNERMDFAGTPANKIDPTKYTTQTNWFEEVMSSTVTHSEDINIQGGTDKSTFNFGVNHLRDDGLIKGDEYERYSVRANYDFHINKALTAGMSLVLSTTRATPAAGNTLLDAYRALPFLTPYNEDGTFSNPMSIDGFIPPDATSRNPAATLFYYNAWSNKVNAITNFFVDWNIIKGLNFRTTLGFNPSYGKGVYFTPKYEVSPNQKSSYNTITKSTSNNLNTSWDNILTYELNLNQIHNIKAMAGYSYREQTTDYLSATADNIVDLPEISQSFLFLTIGKGTGYAVKADDGGSRKVQIGYMGRLNYDFKHKYLLNVTMRADGSSIFPETNRWGYFPSVGLGWVASEESFIKNISAINFLKLRVGWGLLGNDNIPSNLYQLTTSGGSPVIFGPDQNGGTGLVSPAVTISKSFNPDLQWEVVNETNIGFDAHLLNDKLGVSFDWYNKLTTNAIFATTALGSTGLNSSGVWGNYADILNRGIELTLSWNDKKGDFGYNVDFNFTYNQNEVTAINAAGASFFDQGDATDNITPLTRTQVGHPIGEFYGYHAIGVFQNQAEIDSKPHLQNTMPGHLIFEDIDGNGIIDAKDRTAIGNPNPPVIYGFNLGLNYKSFDFNVFLQGVHGNKIFNENRVLMSTTRNYDNDFYENRWYEEGSSTEYPSVMVTAGDQRTPNSFYVEDGSYFRIKAVQLGYTLPLATTQKWHVEKFRVYVNAENMFTFFTYNGFSPEVPSDNPLLTGINKGIYPLSSIYSFGINLIF